MLKYKFSFLFVFILLLCGFSFVSADNYNLDLLGKVIYIDPGHGGVDPGAVYKDIYEADINLEICNTLASTLEKYGAIVYLTRYDNYDLSVTNSINRKRSDLSRRANIINKSLCDIYISIHLNAETSSTWFGAQVFYDDINPKNEQIAKIMQNIFKKDLKSKREYKEITDKYMHKRIERPGILAEVGFISNENERYLLRQKTYQQKLANAITKGVIEYFNSN